MVAYSPKAKSCIIRGATPRTMRRPSDSKSPTQEISTEAEKRRPVPLVDGSVARRKSHQLVAHLGLKTPFLAEIDCCAQASGMTSCDEMDGRSPRIISGHQGVPQHTGMCQMNEYTYDTLTLFFLACGISSIFSAVESVPRAHPISTPPPPQKGKGENVPFGPASWRPKLAHPLASDLGDSHIWSRAILWPSASPGGHACTSLFVASSILVNFR